MDETTPTSITPADVHLAEVERRAADAEQRAAEAEVQSLRSSIGAQHSIRPDYLDFLTASDTDTITAQAQRLVELGFAVKPPGNIAPTEGRTPTFEQTRRGHSSPTREFTNQLFGRDTDLNWDR